MAISRGVLVLLGVPGCFSSPPSGALQSGSPACFAIALWKSWKESEPSPLLASRKSLSMWASARVMFRLRRAARKSLWFKLSPRPGFSFFHWFHNDRVPPLLALFNLEASTGKTWSSGTSLSIRVWAATSASRLACAFLPITAQMESSIPSRLAPSAGFWSTASLNSSKLSQPSPPEVFRNSSSISASLSVMFISRSAFLNSRRFSFSPLPGFTNFH
mmetsp:Transcript_86573/g.232123  ORF Transcript_86573/g.232123 Transcript_86573/m.232123 type:complete len:217 (-) Transcript_86573:819-1469(-)